MSDFAGFVQGYNVILKHGGEKYYVHEQWGVGKPENEKYLFEQFEEADPEDLFLVSYMEKTGEDKYGDSIFSDRRDIFRVSEIAWIEESGRYPTDSNTALEPNFEIRKHK